MHTLDIVCFLAMENLEVLKIPYGNIKKIINPEYHCIKFSLFTIADVKYGLTSNVSE